jgi:hypothetical protein
VVAKAWLGGTGLAVGLGGIVLDTRWLVWCAIGLLALAFAIRFAERRETGNGKGET